MSVPVAMPHGMPSLVQNAAVVSPAHPHTFGAFAPHVLGAVQPTPKPQSGTVRVAPQVSSATRVPQVALSLEQNATSVSLTQPQTFGDPAPPHTLGVAQTVPKPQSGTVRATPQLSGAVTLSQFLPSLAQKAASVSPVQPLPQTLPTPPPPHVLGVVHPAPKLQSGTARKAPQLSVPLKKPQFLPSLAQKAPSVSAEQPQTYAVAPPPQVCGETHVPHDTTDRLVPQLSVPVTAPQFFPIRTQNPTSVSGVHALPQTFGAPPPPQEAGALQVPQEATVRLVPQLSVVVTLPQVLLSLPQNAASDSAVHPQTNAVPPPPQVSGDVQVPQEATVRVAPQMSVPVTLPQFLARRVQNAASVSLAQPQTLGVDPPQVLGALHPAPKLQSTTVRVFAQLSLAVTPPQFFPTREQKAVSVSVMHPQT
jgi:hypothetical protein